MTTPQSTQDCSRPSCRRGSAVKIKRTALALLVAITTSALIMTLLLWRLEARQKLVSQPAAALQLRDDCSSNINNRNSPQAIRQEDDAPLLQDGLPAAAVVEPNSWPKDLGKTHTLPHVVQRMQAGAAMDWHVFIKQSRTPTDDDPDFPVTPARSHVSALQVGAFFSGLEFEEHMFGPLADYAGCSVLADPCAIHGLQAICVMDAFCGWCERSSLCLSRANQQQHCTDSQLFTWDTTAYRAAYAAHPGVPFKIASGGTLRQEFNITQCNNIVPGVILDPQFLVNTMLHHWHADAWPGIVQQWWAAVDTAQQLGSNTSLASSNQPIPGYATVLKEGRDILPNIRFLYADRYKTTFFYHLGLLSHCCPMQKEKIPDGTCFVKEIPSLGPLRGHINICADDDCFGKVPSSVHAAKAQGLQLPISGSRLSSITDPTPLSGDPFALIVQRLGLEGVGNEHGRQIMLAPHGSYIMPSNSSSATRRPVVLLLQRLVKRFILNIEELAEAIRQLGAEAVI